MPKIYRVMEEGDGRPRTGDGRNLLGARPGSDVHPDADGNVHPVGQGMSVNICICSVPVRIVPGRLQHLRRGAIGDDERRVWRNGSGDFTAGPIAPGLEFQPDAKTPPVSHGVVRPDAVMPLADYQSALTATQEQWEINEQRNPDCPFCGC